MKRSPRPSASSAAPAVQAAAMPGEALLLAALQSVRQGDFAVRLPADGRHLAQGLATAFNDIVALNEALTQELSRLNTTVGQKGRLDQRAALGGARGGWASSLESVNGLIEHLAQPLHGVSRVIDSVTKGDLSQGMALEFEGRPLEGELLRAAKTVNQMLDQLTSFASEVTRVAREVGTEGKLGGQARVAGVAGTWNDLTLNVNLMAEHLTNQVRGIARVVTAVANGDLKRKLVLDAKGEIAVLAETINAMIETLALFADQVSTVAREVGVEGRLGGQARVPGAAGTWRDLTDNVNQLAANLTGQVRAIGAVTTAVSQGDLTPRITVAASGEVASLKDAINGMIVNLKETTQKNHEQDWLNSNLARIGRLLQGQRDVPTVSRRILSELADLVAARHGLFFVPVGEGEGTRLELRASYASTERQAGSDSFRVGEGLVGQAALEKRIILVRNVPDSYMHIASGLGAGKPLCLIVIPVLFEGELKAVIELASFNPPGDVQLAFLEQLGESLGVVLHTIAAMTRTEELLSQSLTQAERLLMQQEQLQRTNAELADRARLLTEQKVEVEIKNREVETAKQALEQKAVQLALSSRYKSEFLANMSHELRTPLNSLLLLARILADNKDGNLSAKQVEYARTVHSSGVDLLTLINEILDLAKIESGTVVVEFEAVQFADLTEFVESTFREIAEDKGLRLEIHLDPTLEPALQTDLQRLKQVLRNLLSNAFKFTREGSVTMVMRAVTGGWSPDRTTLNEAGAVVAFEVSDTGTGIATENQETVFEAFRQADGTTSRKYGGTGLGLSISREIAHLLGGDLQLVSAPDEGSTFTLYVPIRLGQASQQPPARAITRGATVDPVRSVVLPRPVKARLPLADDRESISSGDRVLLIIEDDPAFARVLLDLARTKGFKGVVALDGDVGLALARTLLPAALTLDLMLPGADGWTVLDRLKIDPATRHIPVAVISVAKGFDRATRLGALACLAKPVTQEDVTAMLITLGSFLDRDIRRLLLVEGDERARQAVSEFLGDGDVVTVAVSTGAEALALLEHESFDCIVLDLGLPDMDGITVLERIKGQRKLKDLPVIVYTGHELSREQARRLDQLSALVIRKDAQSPQRLLAETARFLHRVDAALPEAKRALIAQAQAEHPTLAGRQVLIVDDDVRNIFALTSLLEGSRMEVIAARDGQAALDRLATNVHVDVILMDIMMPGLDGYATMRAIRARKALAGIPIIAVTAKAMTGDREKCIAAGASDYITKPVNPVDLLSLLRTLLGKVPIGG